MDCEFAATMSVGSVFHKSLAADCWQFDGRYQAVFAVFQPAWAMAYTNQAEIWSEIALSLQVQS